MFLVAGLSPITGRFSIPEFQDIEGRRILPIADSFEEIQRFSELGHIYKFQMPNIVTLVQKTDCEHYSAIDTAELGIAQEWAVLAAILTTPNGLQLVTQGIMELAGLLIEEMRTSEHLQRRLDWYIQMFEEFPHPRCTIDQNGRIVRANAAFRELSGGELIKHCEKLPSGLKPIPRFVQEVLEKRESRQYTLQHDGAVYMWCFIPTYITIDDKQHGYCTVIAYVEDGALISH